MQIPPSRRIAGPSFTALDSEARVEQLLDLVVKLQLQLVDVVICRMEVSEPGQGLLKRPQRVQVIPAGIPGFDVGVLEVGVNAGTACSLEMTVRRLKLFPSI